jgi:hypothetical protein
MNDWSQMFSNGMSARIVEGYQFPFGDMLKGEIFKDGKVVFRTQPRKTECECRLDMIRFLEMEIEAKDADIQRMNALKSKMEC